MNGRSLASHLLLGLVASALHAQPAVPDWSEAYARTEEAFADFEGKVSPGCAIGVIYQGDYVFAKGYGMANLEHKIPIDADTVFRIASASKQFTATAIALLARSGRLDLDADIHRYLPDLVDYEYQVTIRQIVHQLSGIPDYEDYGSPFVDATGKPFSFGAEDYYSPDEFYDLVKALPLEHQPESAFAYSNTGYFLLSRVVRRVTGLSLREFTDREIFSVLDMRQTQFLDNADEVVDDLATGYRRREDGTYERHMTNLDWVGDGALHTSLSDFLKWDRNFYSNRLADGGPELIDMLQTAHPFYDDIEPNDTFAGGSLSPYAWGLFVMKHRGYKVIGHPGDWVGYRSHYLRYPELELSFVVLCNAGDESHVYARVNAIRDPYINAVEQATNP